MGILLFERLQNLWPLSIFKFDDLRESNKLVRKLSIPEHTKQFVYAVRNSESDSVIYVLSVQSLSQQSISDVEWLVRAVKPEAVMVQVGNASLNETCSCNTEDVVPTSSLEVVVRSFWDKVNKEKYENVAGQLVLREIFGSDFHGHVVAAKRAAKEVNSSFFVLETPFGGPDVGEDGSGEIDSGRRFFSLVSSLVPQKVGSVISTSSRMFCVHNDVQSQMVKMLSTCIDVSASHFGHSDSVPHAGMKEIQPVKDFQVPSFAQSVYSLLLDLHDIFADLPSIGKALACSQKMLSNVNQGEVVETNVISEVYTFRIAVEGLRIALNTAGRLPLSKLDTEKRSNVDFSELPVEDKSHALLAQALQSQSKKFKSIVSVVDASVLAGLRRHWNTVVSHEVKSLVEELITEFDGDEDASSHRKKWLFSNKPVVAVGAGATAVIGASSLSKVVPASTVVKGVMFKLPTAMKLMLTHTQKSIALAMSKTVGPSKFMAPGLAKPSVLKAAASADKIRTVAHSIIASVEKTSLSAMRTAFYEIMRKRQVRPIGVLPWAAFGCSIATCSALLMYGDGIEYAAESLPAAPSIASLGRGIQRLRQTSQEVRQTDGNRIQKSIEAMMYRFSKSKVLKDDC